MSSINLSLLEDLSIIQKVQSPKRELVKALSPTIVRINQDNLSPLILSELSNKLENNNERGELSSPQIHNFQDNSNKVPNSSLDKSPDEILTQYNLDKSKYKLAFQSTNYGKKTGLPNKCNYCKLDEIQVRDEAHLIPIGKPMIRLTEITKVEFSEKVFYKSWLFHNINCLTLWLDEHNPSEMI